MAIKKAGRGNSPSRPAVVKKHAPIDMLWIRHCQLRKRDEFPEAEIVNALAADRADITAAHRDANVTHRRLQFFGHYLSGENSIIRDDNK